jgi:hypothetical protein
MADLLAPGRCAQLEAVPEGSEEVGEGTQGEVLPAAEALRNVRFGLSQSPRKIRFGDFIFGHDGGKQFGRFQNQFLLLNKFFVDVKEILRNVHFVLPVLLSAC